MDTVVMHHNFRQGNEVAHILAKHVGAFSAFNKIKLLLFPPLFVMTRMLADKGGHDFVKTISITTYSQLARIDN